MTSGDNGAFNDGDYAVSGLLLQYDLAVVDHKIAEGSEGEGCIMELDGIQIVAVLLTIRDEETPECVFVRKGLDLVLSMLVIH